MPRVRLHEDSTVSSVGRLRDSDLAVGKVSVVGVVLDRGWTPPPDEDVRVLIRVVAVSVSSVPLRRHSGCSCSYSCPRVAIQRRDFSLPDFGSFPGSAHALGEVIRGDEGPQVRQRSGEERGAVPKLGIRFGEEEAEVVGALEQREAARSKMASACSRLRVETQRTDRPGAGLCRWQGMQRSGRTGRVGHAEREAKRRCWRRLSLRLVVSAFSDVFIAIEKSSFSSD